MMVAFRDDYTQNILNVLCDNSDGCMDDESLVECVKTKGEYLPKISTWIIGPKDIGKTNLFIIYWESTVDEVDSRFMTMSVGFDLAVWNSMSFNIKCLLIQQMLDEDNCFCDSFTLHEVIDRGDVVHKSNIITTPNWTSYTRVVKLLLGVDVIYVSSTWVDNAFRGSDCAYDKGWVFDVSSVIEVRHVKRIIEVDDYIPMTSESDKFKSQYMLNFP